MSTAISKSSVSHDESNSDCASDAGAQKPDNEEFILGYPVSLQSVGACVAQILDWIESGVSGRYFACANPHALMVAEKDESFRRSLMQADLLTPDGAGLVLVSRLRGGRIGDRVTGSDIFENLSSEMDRRGGMRCFFLGSTPETLAAIEKRMGEVYPNIKVCGTYSPPFKPEFDEDDNAVMQAVINEARPHVVWVGMTAPKQEKWISDIRRDLDVPFIAPIGAVFDFFTGNVKRSHPIFQRLGLEWLPRLLQEPRRLWRRTLVSGPAFLWRVLTERPLGAGREFRHGTDSTIL